MAMIHFKDSRVWGMVLKPAYLEYVNHVSVCVHEICGKLTFVIGCMCTCVHVQGYDCHVRFATSVCEQG